MEVKRRTQEDRSAATRDALVAAARPLFAERGFGGVGTEAIASAAGVTRGALYHQFEDKVELFAAVYERLEEEIVGRLGERIAREEGSGAIEEMHIGAAAWLDASMDPEIQQIVLLDGPAVLGWQRWREIGMRYGLGLMEAVLRQAMDEGSIPEQPVSALAHVLVGAIDEAALYVARAEDQEAARAEVEVVVRRLVDGLAA